ncbi:hypothetical protein MIMGU_mgv11b020874mg [Erythranthe guttata]|uniref:F-box associated beta-propeller type 1 domain-containing protein n=1 Tax=Erythranthe guttata TaxID=4155 RepID=A0A022QRG0_ERYGU|nr:hypothetical protein MIMGU_mgv11b020874mg [Erythranthe guttata]
MDESEEKLPYGRRNHPLSTAVEVSFEIQIRMQVMELHNLWRKIRRSSSPAIPTELRQPRHLLLVREPRLEPQLQIPTLQGTEAYLHDKIKRKFDPTVLCYCDGLALIRYPKLHHNSYLLYNLSTGTHVDFSCPHEIYYRDGTVYGICHDPSTNDYKVVVINKKHYAVYYCRSMRWGALKETPDELRSRGLILGKGVSLNGDLYFVFKSRQDWGYGIKIVGFDPTREYFTEFPEPRYVKKDSVFMYMTCLEGYLYLCFDHKHCQMIKVQGDQADQEEEQEWIEFDGEPPFSERVKDDLYSTTTTREDETIFFKCGYTMKIGYHRIPYLENLFIGGGGGHKQVMRRKEIDIV